MIPVRICPVFDLAAARNAGAVVTGPIRPVIGSIYGL